MTGQSTKRWFYGFMERHNDASGLNHVQCGL